MQHEQNAQGKHEQTTGQGAKEQSTKTQHEQGKQAQQPNRGEREQAKGRNQPQTQGQAAQPQQGQQSKRQQAQPQQGQAQPQHQQGQAQQAQPQQGQKQATGAAQQTQAGGHVTLTEQQRTQIRETVLAKSDVPRLNSVNFALTAGTIVPSTVHVVAVPETLIAIYPEWREDMYFVVRDDIVIVDHSHRIVALVPVGSAGAQALAPGQGSSMALNLSRDEIRQVQIMLNEKGFNVGEPDGVLGERTRAALMQFQQRQGFHATGQIDHETMAALGVSKGGGQQGQQGQPSSTGQAGGTANQPNAKQGSSGQQGNQGNQPSTAGQGSPSTQQPGANPPAAKQGTGTSGQSSGKTPQNMNPNAGSSAAPQRQTK
jgi:hypothetical protein